MKTLKVQVKKDIYEEIVSGKLKEFGVSFTKTLAKRMSKSGNATPEQITEDNNLIENFDELNIACFFSSDSVTFPLKKIVIDGNDVVFTIKNTEKKETKEHNEKSVTTEETKKEKKTSTFRALTIEELKEDDRKRITKRISEVLDKFCKNQNVIVVGTPRVSVRPNGVLFGLNRTLPIKNDVAINVDIEKQRFYFTYDMTENDFIEQFEQFLKKALFGNFVFIWKSKCAYKESKDGKRFLTLFYTTRKFVNQTKRLL